jgi:hypothetical protein
MQEQEGRVQGSDSHLDGLVGAGDRSPHSACRNVRPDVIDGQALGCSGFLGCKRQRVIMHPHIASSHGNTTSGEAKSNRQQAASDKQQAARDKQQAARDTLHAWENAGAKRAG